MWQRYIYVKMMKSNGKTAECCQRVVDTDICGIDLTVCKVVNGDHHRLSLAFTVRDLEDEKKFPAIGPEGVSAGPGTASHFGVSYPEDRGRIDSEHKVHERADNGSKVRFCCCPNCGSNLYWESDRSPAMCGVAGGASVDANLPPPGYSIPPGSSICENGMFQWLALPTVTDHFPESRPPVAS